MNKHTRTINIYTPTFKDSVAQPAYQLTREPPTLPTASYKNTTRDQFCLIVTLKLRYYDSCFYTAALTENLHGLFQANTGKRKMGRILHLS